MSAAGLRECPACGGVGHVQVTAEQLGWVLQPDGRWLLPGGGLHRFLPGAGAYVFRPCDCRAALAALVAKMESIP